MSHFSLYKTLLAAALILASSVSADDAPAERLKSTIDGILNVLSETEFGYEEKRTQVQGFLDNQFNFEGMVKGALGRHRNALSKEELTKVTSLVTDLLIRAYLREFSDGPKPAIIYKNTVELTKNKIEVPSVITIDGKNVNLTYRLAKLESGWQVYDLIVEGVSMVRNYREQFDKHFQTKGVPELIELIAKKIEDM